jgi:hypothetical protein
MLHFTGLPETRTAILQREFGGLWRKAVELAVDCTYTDVPE